MAAHPVSIENTKQRSIDIPGQTDEETDGVLVCFGLAVRETRHGLVVVLFERVVD